MKFTSHSEQETKDFAKKYASELTGGVILCLYGELGAGKTTFVKGLAEGLGIEENITSPTFTLMNIYNIKTKEQENKRTMVHIDTYRLKDEKEMIEIGAEDYIGTPNTISVIEWPEKILSLLEEIRQRRTGLGPEKVVKISLNHSSENNREITIE